MYVTSYLYTNLILSFNLSICLSVRMPMCAVCTSSLCICEYLGVCASTYLASMRLQPMYLYYACMFRCMSVTGPGCIDARMGCLRLCARASMQPPAWVCLCVCTWAPVRRMDSNQMHPNVLQSCTNNRRKVQYNHRPKMSKRHALSVRVCV